MWIMQTRFELVHGMSMVSRKTHHCSQRDHDAIMHILQYLNADPSLPLVYLRAPLYQRATDNRDIRFFYDIRSFINGDGSNNDHGSKGPPGDQIGFRIKSFPMNGAIRAVSKFVVVAPRLK